jgi:hypothetical protein
VVTNGDLNDAYAGAGGAGEELRRPSELPVIHMEMVVCASADCLH